VIIKDYAYAYALLESHVDVKASFAMGTRCRAGSRAVEASQSLASLP